MSELKFNLVVPPEQPKCTPFPSTSKKVDDYMAPPKIIALNTNSSLVNYIRPPKIVLFNGKYVLVERNFFDGEAIIKKGFRYLITSNGVYESGKHETSLVSNFRPIITRFIHLYDVNGKFEEYIEGIALTKETQYPWRVKKRDYKNLFKILHNEFGDIFVTKNLRDGSEAALSDLYQEAKKDGTVPTDIEVEISGWHCIDDKCRWHTGIDEEYADVEVPDVSALDKTQIFKDGLTFLDIGRYNSQIGIIFLFAHAAISRWWMKKASIDWKTVLIVQGVTNSFKTFTVSQVANVFSKDRNKVRLPISLITDSAGRRKITKLRGQVALIDDYSKSSKYSAERSRELAEKLIRMNGDSGGHIKSAGGNTRQTITETVECVLIFTAETDFGLGNSSNTRCVTVRTTAPIVDRDGNLIKPATFDKEVIQHVQDNHEIMRCYFASYINFLTEHGSSLLSVMKQKFRDYRSAYNKKFHTPRMAESAAMLKLQADLICEFARYSGIIATDNLAAYFENSIGETISAQQEKTLNYQPTVLFLQALHECLESRKIAETETDYVVGYDYVGFHQHSDGTLWLDKDWAWDAASNLLRKRGIEWLTTFETLKEMLYEQGFIFVQKRVENGKERITYLPRAKKGLRTSKLVLFYQKFLKISEGGLLS